MLQASEDCALKCYVRKPALSPKQQRPLQTILKRKGYLPSKPESKLSTNEAKVAKVETKKQEEVKKSVPLPAPVEPPLQGGHYELNARMTRMVETELRDIMIKVWHELPDNPTDEAEALVVDKLRNQAGDDLRNVLGLNITKRLLNVHNPLYVKVQFSGKPEKVHLGEFLKKYNFTAFKRFEKTVNMFAAQVKTITDFDRVCSAKDIRCGDIKVTVYPSYKFTKCPPNLVTSFYNQEDDASDETTETNEKDNKLDAKTDKTPEKVVTKTENVLTNPKIEDTKEENVTKLKDVNKPVENKTNKATVNKLVTENKTTVEKPVSETLIENKAAVKPTVENKAAVNKPAVENKTAVNKTSVNKPTENSINKPAVHNKVVTKPAVDNKPGVNKPTVEDKTVAKTAVVNKPAVINKPAVVKKPAAENKANIVKPSVENKDFKKPQVNPKMNDTGRKPAPSPVKTPIRTNDKADKNKKHDDYDELDDHDILALMSEGIVLDECSGSDDE